jgi:hypothetical protein
MYSLVPIQEAGMKLDKVLLAGAGLEGIMGMHLNTHDFCKSMLFYQ